jgi:signal transduction histidine kinase
MTASAPPLPEHATFALERFAWDAPDRLEVSGWFSGLHDAPPEPPTLVVRGGDGIHRLPAVPDRLSGPVEAGRRWWAAFAWQDVPAAFERAELELGAAIMVELPEPRPERKRRGDQVLEVRTRVPDGGAVPGAGERHALETALLVAQEELREVRAALERAHAELARARQDLEAEHERRAVASERFREGLARVRGSAREAMAAQRAGIGAARAEAERLLARLTSLADKEQT